MDVVKKLAMRHVNVSALAKINMICILAIILLLVLNHFINQWGGAV